MTRIFASLSLVALIALAANLLIGLATGEHQQAAAARRKEHQAFRLLEHDKSATKADIQAGRERLSAANAAFKPYSNWLALHLLVGVVGAMLVLLVNSITVTYFIGTSRWCKEVVDAYRLDPELVEESRRIKARCFPWSTFGMLAVIGIVGLGAAADPGGWMSTKSALYVTPHYIAVLVGVSFIAYSFWMQWIRIAENHTLIEKVMTEVRRRRDSRQETAEAGA